MSEVIEYIVSCSCGGSLRLGLTERQQRVGKLRKSTAILADLFRVFHEEHGTVTGFFSDVPGRGGEIDTSAADGIDARREREGEE